MEKINLKWKFEEIIYLNQNGDITEVSNESQIVNVKTIWLNSSAGVVHNDEFSALLTDEAVPCFFNRYGIITGPHIKEYNANCNGLIRKSTRTDKIFVIFTNKDEFNDFSLFKDDTN